MLVIYCISIKMVGQQLLQCRQRTSRHATASVAAIIAGWCEPLCGVEDAIHVRHFTPWSTTSLGPQL